MSFWGWLRRKLIKENSSEANLYKGMYARTFMEITGIDIKKVKKKGPEEMKSVRMQIRTTPKISKWMKENKVSPSLVFEKAAEEK